MLLEGISRNHFVIIGRAGIDFFTDPGVRAEDAERVGVGLGGSAANIAAGICKLGGKAALVTRVSDDSIGSYCIRQLEKYGVETTHVRPVGGEYRNSLAFYETVSGGHRNVIYRNGAADFQMDENDVSAVDYASFGALITAGTVFAAEPSRSASFMAFERAKTSSLPIIFDVDYRPYSWPSAEIASDILSRAAALSDMIVGNDVEFGFMAGDYDKGLEKARELARTSAQLVIYKMGEEGAITITRDEEFKTGVYPVTALKPVGAGDSFMSGLLTSIANGFSLEDSVLHGSACASIVVSKPGCASAMPDPSELEEFLSSHPGPTSA
ncbi:5-dehydro-2-deoxygluconokinase [Rhizobiales bacterium]|uniref:5-dehydro-2-deoxygluconokinase n=1 Tax=Hongsoonwoonella zoysiae TaxID=2821844 RepID=UPI001560713D|nr:5-dehydro-2-deoxygluconokinase [Hongsoonwoonella zoysiae]NRG16079.1 5-dehydro-2-deoxygluconokinase [Hongsoonwoonella zoysiae]